MKTYLIWMALALGSVSMASANEYYVAPTGCDSNSGTEEAPLLNIHTAIDKAKAGDAIYLREGTYRPSAAEIMREKGEGNVYDCVFYLSANGTSQKPITLAGCPGEKVVIDLSDIKTENRIMGFNLHGDYWHLKNFDIIGIQVTQTGHTQSINVGLFGGSNCIVENVNMHDGMGIGVYATKGSNNLVLNCDAYNNYDYVSENGKGGNCDGFGFHLNSASYTGNVLRGCRAWRNSDDGFDLINNAAPVVIERCWAWENGYDADMISRGDGTGIKSGGYGMGSAPKVPTVVPRNIIRNCIAYGNKNQGFYANHHLGGLDFINNSGYGNPRNFNMVNRKSAEEAVDVDGYGHNLANNVSFSPKQSGADCVNINRNLSTLSNNTFDENFTVSADDFKSLESQELLLPRKEDGSLPDINFLKFKEDSEGFKTGMGWEFDISSVVSAALTYTSERTICYNLQGVRVANPETGIYINNRKKVLKR